jgi:hypothetical protein
VVEKKDISQNFQLKVEPGGCVRIDAVHKNTLTQNSGFVSSTSYYDDKSIASINYIWHPSSKLALIEHSFIISHFRISLGNIITRLPDESI